MIFLFSVVYTGTLISTSNEIVGYVACISKHRYNLASIPSHSYIMYTFLTSTSKGCTNADE